VDISLKVDQEGGASLRPLGLYLLGDSKSHAETAPVSAALRESARLRPRRPHRAAFAFQQLALIDSPYQDTIDTMAHSPLTRTG